MSDPFPEQVALIERFIAFARRPGDVDREDVARRSTRPVDHGVRTCNITPGGHISFGPNAEFKVDVRVTNYYSGVQPNLVDIENRLQISVGDDYAQMIDVPVTRQQLLDAAQAFLAMANRRGGWPPSSAAFTAELP